jgi:hypothetical protein
MQGLNGIVLNELGQRCTDFLKLQEMPQTLDTRTLTLTTILHENPQILGIPKQTFVTQATWCLGFVHA